MSLHTCLHTIQELLADMEEAHSSEQVCLDIVDVIVEKGAAIFFQHYLEQQAQQRTAADTIENALQAVEVWYIFCVCAFF
jgi:hypothetical protein